MLPDRALPADRRDHDRVRNERGETTDEVGVARAEPRHHPRRAAKHGRGVVRLIDATDRQRGFGDYLGYGLVAEGKAEIYAELDLKPWDLAAPKIVVEEAGGRFTDFRGRATIYSGTALATNGRLHDAARALLAP